MKKPFSVSFKNYSCFYRVKGFPPVQALTSFTITDIKNGEIVFVVGPNGSGKSTFLDAICGRLRADTGWPEWNIENGARVADLRLAYVPQMPDNGIVAELTILENLVLRRCLTEGAGLSIAVTTEMRSEVLSFLKDFNCQNLVEKLGLPPTCLSGGQRQILNLLSVTFADPPLIVLDEPTSKLDEKNRIVLMSLLVRASIEKGAAILCATHDIDMVGRIADRVFPLRDGKPAKSERRRNIGDFRSPGAVRFAQKLNELPSTHQSVPEDWWMPQEDKLFGCSYESGDDSEEGYLSGQKMNRMARTLREVAGIQKLLSISPSSDLCIADVPCGWGRHAVELAKLGYIVNGVDINPKYIAEANASASTLIVKPTFIVADMAETTLADSSQNVVLNMWTSFGFFDEEKNKRSLREFSRILKRGGKLLIHSDLNPRRVQYGIFDEPSRRHLAKSKTLSVVEYYCDETACIHGTWEVKDAPSFSYKIKVYKEDQWELMANEAGLKIEGFYGSFEGHMELSIRSQEFIVVMSKL
jgi:ABC-type multidrug transport system ATPase subunit/ubiquinone/menaquinone biosynthesis C-methylase UbiE